MKKTIQITIISIIAFFTTSCNYLDVVPDDIPTLDQAFADRYIAETFLGTCYWHLPRLAGWNENPALGGSLEVWFPTEGPHFANSIYIGRGMQNASNPQCNYWSGGNGGKNLYAGIRDCNIFLEKIEGVKDLDQTEKNRWIAEVKFLKAYYHFYLIRMYGPICIIKENTPVYENTEAFRLYRQPVDECFNYVISLLDEAINSNALPVSISNLQVELGRITKPIAMAIKAQVLIYHASPLFNGNQDFAGFVNETGKPFFNQIYDANRWTKAATACKDAIDVCAAANISLYQKEDYSSQFPLSDEFRLNIGLRNSVSERWNKELIWGLSTWIIDWGFQQAAQARFDFSEMKPAKSYYATPLNTAELFYTSNGIPINEDVSFNGVNLYEIKTATSVDNAFIAQNEQTARLNFNREPRFYAYLGFDRGRWLSEVNVKEPMNSPIVKNRYGEPSSVANPGEYCATGYFPKKLVNFKNSFKDPNNYIVENFPFPAMRLADLYLMYAEALCESGAPLNDAYFWVDKIRNRAGLKGVVESWQNYSSNPNKPQSKEGALQIIRTERMIELSLEGSQYWDLRRWKTAPQVLNRAIKGWNVMSSASVDYYTVKVLTQQKFSTKDYFSPIPEREIMNNPKLVQNPGW